MKEKELDIYIWLHHIATFFGLFCGMRVLAGKKLSKCRICVLVLYIETQIWGAVKIIRDVRNGRFRLRDSFVKIQKHRQSTCQERAVIAGLTCGSVIFKAGVPWLAGKACRKD